MFFPCLCTRLFICALWSPAGKGLTSWLLFVVSNCEFGILGQVWYLIVSIPDLCTLTYIDIATIIDNNSKRILNLQKDVQRPLINNVCVFLFQNIDGKCVKRARRAATSAFVKLNAFIVNVNKVSF